MYKRQPLISFTQEDVEEIGVSADASTLSEGRITYQDFKKQGFYSVEPNDAIVPTGGPVFDFVADEAHADPSKLLDTQTGLLEIYSQNLANYYQVFGLDACVGPCARYEVGPSGYEEAARGEYPLQYVNVHPNRRPGNSWQDSASRSPTGPSACRARCV